MRIRDGRAALSTGRGQGATRPRVGGSLIFNGVSSSGALSGGGGLTPNAWKIGTKTIEFQVKLSASPGGIQPVFALDDAQYYAAVAPSNESFLSYRNGSDVQTTLSANAGAIADNVWQHVAWVWSVSGSNVTTSLYVAGVLVKSQTLATGNSAAYGGSPFLGQLGGGALFFAGKLSIGSIYNVALSAGEIALRAAGIDIARPPVSRWQFLEGSGTSLADSLGVGSWTLSNTTWSADVPY